MALHHAAVGCAVLVHLAADEALHHVHIGFAGALHLADLHDPDALELLGCGLVPGVGQTEGVTKPFPAQLPEQCALADARLAVQDEDGVKLAAGGQHALDRSDQGLAGHGAGVGGVLGAQVVDQQRVNSGHAVPFRQALDVLPQRIEAAAVRHGREGLCEAVFRELDAVGVSHPRVEMGVVHVPPVFVGARPRQPALDLDGAAQLVEADPLKGGVVLQDQHGVGDQRLDVAVLRPDQLRLPAVVDVIRERHALEVQDRLALAVVRERQADAWVFARERGHGLEAWAVLASLVFLAVVQIVELVETDQVEGIAELAAGGVGAVI